VNGVTVHHSYALPGVYTVTLTVSDGALGASATVLVTVIPGGGTRGTFHDAFDRPDAQHPGSAWAVLQGQAGIQGRELRSAAVAGRHVMVVAGLRGTTQEASAEFSSPDSNGAPRFGIILRYRDAGNYYLAYRQAGGSSVLRISRVAGGKETVLKQVNVKNPVATRRSGWRPAPTGSCSPSRWTGCRASRSRTRRSRRAPSASCSGRAGSCPSRPTTSAPPSIDRARGLTFITSARPASRAASGTLWVPDRRRERVSSKGRPYRTVHVDGFEVLIGKGDAENDLLTFEVAEPHDLWLHVGGGVPGSHVVVRNPERLDDLPRAVIERAAALAAWHSKARHAGKVDVHLCRVADVSKPRGMPPGKVLLARWKRLRVFPGTLSGSEPTTS
jgi:hypothetical protein